MTAIDTDTEDVKAMFDVNVFGAMRMVHHFHGMLIESSGTIVNIGSVGGIVPYVYGCECRLPFCSFRAVETQLNRLELHYSILQCLQGCSSALVKYFAGRDGTTEVSSAPIC